MSDVVKILRIEMSEPLTKEVFDIFEIEHPTRENLDLITDAIMRHWPEVYNPGSWGRGWNHSSVGYTRVDGKGFIKRKAYGTSGHRWDVYAFGQLICSDVITRRNAVNICDSYLKNINGELP